MRIVVKVGTSTLAYGTGRMNLKRTRLLCETLIDLKNAGNQVLLVSSGAIGMGVGKLGLKEKPKDIPTKQAAASVGQCELMYAYDRIFSEYGYSVGQILLTGSDFSNPERVSNFTNTMERLLELNVLPIINENDTVATEEIKVGDNDTLSALVAVNTKADLLVILSDIDGLYTVDPKKDETAKRIPLVKEITSELLKIAGGEGSSLGTGGMKTKLHAASLCMENGCDMIIVNGENPTILYDVVDGKPVGTKFSNK